MSRLASSCRESWRLSASKRLRKSHAALKRCRCGPNPPVVPTLMKPNSGELRRYGTESNGSGVTLVIWEEAAT